MKTHFWRDYRTVFRKELRDLLRDRRSLFWLLAPPIILPAIAVCAALFIGTQAVRLAEEGVAVYIDNVDEAPALVEDFEEADEVFLVQTEAEAMVIVSIPDDFQEKIDAGETANIDLIIGDNSVITFFATTSVRLVIDTYRDEILQQRLESRGITDEFLDPIIIGEQTRVSEDSLTSVTGTGGEDGEGGTNIVATIFLPLAVTSYLVGGGIGLILDTTVGEKERQTIENILVTPVNRVSVVMGKMTVVFMASMVVMGMWLSEGVVISSFGSASTDLVGQENASFTDLAQIALENTSSALALVLALLVMIIPFMVLINALVMAWCAYAANYREGNLFMALVQLGLPATVLLSIFSFPSDVSELIYGLPLFGTIVAIRDLFSSTLSFAGLIINLISTLLYAGGAILLAAWVFGREWSLTRGLQ